MPEFTPDTLALADDVHDREHASNRSSRYGAYLDQHAHLFTDDGYPLDAAQFAAAAWTVATSPIMAPGYVRIRPDLLGVKVYTDDDGVLLMNVLVPVRQHALAHRPAGLADWTSSLYAQDTGTAWRPLAEPTMGARSALLLTASLVIPVPAGILDEPAAKGPGPLLLIEAKEAVAELVDVLNRHARVVNELTGGMR
ncbi:hypothetical protein ACFYNO_25075 [Kitasatospora sp. NPDC006697]|uniref:hypothetical protein n=1 Tax=Kitasatospora sp. NPDC006697 TaxID=3364020 RepID=UPI0036C7DFA2